MKAVEIYFSDLNENAQKRLLETANAKTPADLNWDIDAIPITVYEVYELDDETDSTDE